MATTGQRWSPEKIQAMRQELLEGGLTLREVAEREGVSLQRIQQLVGKLDRGRSRSRAQQERVQLLAQGGHSDEDIAQVLKLSLAYVSELRLQSGIMRPNSLKWTRDLIIQTARSWYDRYGFTPTSTDWNPTKAKCMVGRHERARRFYEFGGPYTTTVVTRFGSWSAMIAESKLPTTPVGYAKRKRNSQWRSTTPDDGWDRKAILKRAWEWENHFGNLPRPRDWNVYPRHPKYRELLPRFQEINPPTYRTVRDYFGSFRTMLEAAREERPKKER